MAFLPINKVTNNMSGIMVMILPATSPKPLIISILAGDLSLAGWNNEQHRHVSMIPICKKMQVGELWIWLKSSAHGPIRM